ncbi:hypothetical protein PFISCL1PPCAC_25935 [Pristionchus fissidentatus]|uniref:Uncharacterized protein n=1 Tax=Pristionchus fissidentatus TaxID=1538716 RepID=A0AAV5WTI8_9BILA|nr:hypothetical protein PFISCL1PPCAC_25935 [Pristionchus fissidentatus]
MHLRTFLVHHSAAFRSDTKETCLCPSRFHGNRVYAGHCNVCVTSVYYRQGSVREALRCIRWRYHHDFPDMCRTGNGRSCEKAPHYDLAIDNCFGMHYLLRCFDSCQLTCSIIRFRKAIIVATNGQEHALSSFHFSGIWVHLIYSLDPSHSSPLACHARQQEIGETNLITVTLEHYRFFSNVPSLLHALFTYRFFNKFHDSWTRLIL